ncbi:GIY-YIG nuclease family protein [Cereibacter sphaeroides]|uniref:GIY-YIG nuclease family protein n=1 Tax=Cereibacter sphaeroides TaxID=1063 RepID=UPI001F17EC9C|nr:GIY-YIG nuclease family protein [Cereibacter sphaeroides]MCE6958339.1 GIY-YIG nuclease family protein [Cereibacter sphaeroides]MCE6972206.1 GIY-YIG nuclease family protein [Cereibacter sphaeroides]
MKRWVRPEVQTARDAILKRFFGFGAGPHCVYAVVARSGRSRAPIYVGETVQPRKRFEQHLAAAYGGREDRSLRGEMERNTVRNGGALEFHCLTECANRIEALASEAAWARGLSASGFTLGNTWPEHQLTSTVKLVPLERLAVLSVNEAIRAELEFGLSCPPCDIELHLPNHAVAAACRKNPRLDAIARSLTCPACGRPCTLALFPGSEHDMMRRIDAVRPDVESFLVGIGAASSDDA